jgi:hypothetical protein
MRQTFAYRMLTFWPTTKSRFPGVIPYLLTPVEARLTANVTTPRSLLVVHDSSRAAFHLRKYIADHEADHLSNHQRPHHCYSGIVPTIAIKNMPRCFGTVGQSLIRTRCFFQVGGRSRWNHICMPMGLSDSAKVKAMDHISRRPGNNQPLHKGSAFSNRERYVRSLVIS